MPELPDIVVYLEALQSRVVGERLERLRIASPFLLRSVDPRPDELAGRVLGRVTRLGKRVVFGFDDEYFVILHPIIPGRFGGKPPAADRRGHRLNSGPLETSLAAFCFKK